MSLRFPLWMMNLQGGGSTTQHLPQVPNSETAMQHSYLSFTICASLPSSKKLFGAVSVYVHKDFGYLIDKLRDSEGRCRRPEHVGTVSDSYAHRIKKVDLDDVCWHPKHHAGFNEQWYMALRYILQTNPSSTHTSQEGLAHLQRYFPDVHINAMTIPYESETITVDMVNVILGQIVRRGDVLLVYRTSDNLERVCYQEQARPHWVIDVLLEDEDVLQPSTGMGDPLTWMVTMDPGDNCKCDVDAHARERTASLVDARLTELHFYMTSDSPPHYDQQLRYEPGIIYSTFRETVEVLWSEGVDAQVHKTQFVLMVVKGERSGQVETIRLNRKGVIAWIAAKGDKVTIKSPLARVIHLRNQS